MHTTGPTACRYSRSLNKADFTTFWVRNLHYHSYGRNLESVVLVESLRIGLFNICDVMLLRVSREPGQAVFVMYRFVDISRTYFKFPHQHIAKMPYSSHGYNYYTN